MCYDSRRRETRRPQQHTDPPDTATLAPQFPPASLLGLPEELRLTIYEILWNTALVHIHFRTDAGGLKRVIRSGSHQTLIHDSGEFFSQEGKITWTPCLAVDARSRCLCAHPVWGGTVVEAHRCSDLPSSPNSLVGIFALRRACKKLRQELGDGHQTKAAVSMGFTMLSALPRLHLSAMRHVVTRLNLSGTRYSFDEEADKDAPWRRFLVSVPKPSNINFLLPDPHPSKTPYAEAAAMFPHLETVAIQGFSSFEQVHSISRAIRGDHPSHVDRHFHDQNRKMFTSFNRR